MSKIKEICKKTIKAIEADIVELKIEFRNLYNFEYSRQAQIRLAIKNAREIIEDLEQGCK